MSVSLTKFCKEHGIPKSSAHKRCRELGIATANGLSAEAQQTLISEFNIQVCHDAADPPALEGEILPDGFFKGGELATVENHEIHLPRGFDPLQMAKFFDGVVGQTTDTGSLVKIADRVLDAVETAMDKKIESQRRQLDQSEKDAADLAEKITAGKTRLQIKALESKLVAENQTKATKTAEKLFGDLMAMGKPVDGDSPGSGS